MGFAEEVKQVVSERGQTAEVMESTIAEFNSSADDAPQAAASEDAPVELPVGDSPVEKPKTRIRIGLKEFDSHEAAFEYAQALEMQNVEQEGYKRAQEELKKKEEVPVIDEDEELSQLMFENPKEYVKRMTAKAQAIADKKATDLQVEQQRTSERNTWWNGFWQANPDLQGSSDIVEFILQKNWKELGFINANEAAVKLAEKTRQALRGKRDATLPTEVLPAGPAQVAPSSTTSTPKVIEKPAEAIDFVSQLNNIRRRMKR